MVDTFADISSAEVRSPVLENDDHLKRLPLLSIPLNLEIAAEVFVDDVGTEIETNGQILEGRFSQLDMFQLFVEKRRERNRDRYGPRRSMRDITYGSKAEDDVFLPLHQNYAMLIWTGSTLPSVQQIFHATVKQHEKYVSKEKSGIFWKLEDGRVQFAHYVFVEYFVAIWLFEHRTQSEEIEQYLIEAYKPVFRSKVAFFLDLMMAKGRPLLESIIENKAITTELLSQESQLDLGGRSALHLAAAYGRADAVNKLLEAGCVVSQRDSLLKWTASQYTLDPNVAEKLLERGAELDLEQHIFFVTKISYMLMSDLVETVRSLLNGPCRQVFLKSIALPKPEESIERKLIVSVLLIAAHAGSLRVARLLLDNETKVDGRGPGGRTPLHAATEGRHKDMVELLLKYGADVNVKDIDGRSPIHIAALNGDKDILEEQSTSNFCAEINAIDEQQCTPLHLASSKGHIEAVEFLLDKGADVSLKTVHGHMPIHLTALDGHELAAEVLLLRGADINCRGQYHFTPLHYASEMGHTNMARLLLSHGADVNRTDVDNITPLHLASRSGHLEVAVMLLDAGAHVNAVNLDGWSAFYYASIQGHADIVRLLLARGADAHQNDNKGFVPIQ